LRLSALDLAFEDGLDFAHDGLADLLADEF
jgi:hypothetical protein